MEIFVSAKPHMLLETVELMYAYVNEISPRELTQQGTYCLPVEEVRELLKVACADVSRDSPIVQYYFGKHILTSDACERATCMARHLVYNSMSMSKGTIFKDCQSLRADRRRQLEEHDRIASISEYNLNYVESTDDQFVPMARDITKLGVSPEYSQMLLEEFSGYGDAISRLEKLVTPVAQKLEPLLMPWAERAEPLAQAWRNHSAQPGEMDRLLKRIHYNDEKGMTSIQIQLRYLDPGSGPGMVRMPERIIFLHTGVAIPVEKQAASSFEQWEFYALRLLGSESRMQMLRAMLDQAMSSRELAKALNLHLGVVTRDISSLYDVGLLTLEVKNRNRRYRTNMETLQTIIKHLAELDQYTFVPKDHL